MNSLFENIKNDIHNDIGFKNGHSLRSPRRILSKNSCAQAHRRFVQPCMGSTSISNETLVDRSCDLMGPIEMLVDPNETLEDPNEMLIDRPQ